MDWNQLLSAHRYHPGSTTSLFHSHDRSQFQRDYDRLIFSSPFRRLQNKTQVFPLPGNIFVHNRLTHSLEVASVGRSLGNKVSQFLKQQQVEIENPEILEEIGTIVSTGCLAHDLGNPPFGHSGERAIGTYFSEGNGLRLREQLSELEWQDLIHFEGNANAFRLLTHQFRGRRRGGFVMTYSTLASIVKYPYASILAGEKMKFGFFNSEADDFRRIADELGLTRLSREDEPLRYVRHPLVYLVEAADDICYQVMDMEDAHKLKLVSTEEIRQLFLGFFDGKKREHIADICHMVKDVNEQVAYLRSSVIGALVKECTQAFVTHEEELLAGTFRGCLTAHIASPVKDAYEACSRKAYEKIYRSKDVVDIELAGFKIIMTLLDLLIEAVMSPEKAYSQLLINRVSEQYDIHAPTLYGRIQAVLDYLSGMTDIYALDLFRKINGNSLPAV